MASLIEWVSRRYYDDRIRRERIPGDDVLAVHEALFHTGADAIHQKREDKLRRLMVHAATHVPYWREQFLRLGLDATTHPPIEVLSQLPVLDKPMIRAAGRGMLSEAIPIETMRLNASGGSTGSPLQFYQDESYNDAAQIAAPLFDMWTGWSRGQRIALLWGAPTDLERYGLWRERLRNTLQNRFLVDAFDMDRERLDRAVETLQSKRPKLIIAYSSAAYLVARHMQNTGVRLQHPPCGTIASAEVLWPHYRQVIEESFGCKVHNRYGSREVGLMAMECKHGHMHINATDVIIEVEDPDEEGCGPLLITQLNNLGHPFIRYRIGDIGAVEGLDCPCGRALPVLSSLRGRVGDHIVAPDSTIIHGEWFTHLFYEVPGIVLFTFRQTDKARYVFDVQRGDEFDGELFKLAIDKARKKLGPQAEVDVRFVENFEASPSGKHRFVVNEATDDSDQLLGSTR
jgi:phenylacetate-CoA ligase